MDGRILNYVTHKHEAAVPAELINALLLTFHGNQILRATTRSCHNSTAQGNASLTASSSATCVSTASPSSPCR